MLWRLSLCWNCCCCCYYGELSLECPQLQGATMNYWENLYRQDQLFIVRTAFFHITAHVMWPKMESLGHMTSTAKDQLTLSKESHFQQPKVSYFLTFFYPGACQSFLTDPYSPGACWWSRSLELCQLFLTSILPSICRNWTQDLSIFRQVLQPLTYPAISASNK